MPTFVTKLIHDTSPDFGDNPQTITESGRPESITMQGLTPNTAHYCKGEIYQDGVLNDTSEVETFTTLQAGTLTLTYYNTTRSGYLYDYVFQYTSTYAPSWCTCVVNGSTFNGFFDYNQHVLNFNISGLQPSTTYPTVVTLADIYGETVTVNGSITTTYVNQILIMDTDADENYVDVGLTYVVDGGFYNGWVDVWYDYQDPSTDLSLQHYFFSEGDTVIHCDGLTANTGYLFRASITLDDRTTVINSNVVEESTTVAVVPLSFTDITGIDNTLTLTKNGSAPTVDLEYSTDGTTWTTWTETNNVRTLTIPANGTVYLRGNNSNGFASGTENYHNFSSTGNVNASGDLTTIINKSGTTTMPQWGVAFLFVNMSTLKTPPELPATTLANACYKQLFVGTGITTAPVLPATTLAESCYEEMFVFCQSLTTPPALPATTLASYCYSSMFGYSAITTAPDIMATTITNAACRAMFEWCGSLTTPPRIPNATTVGDYSFSNTFYGCGNMTEGIDFRNITSAGYRAFEGCYIDNRSLNVAYAPTITWNTETTDVWLYGVAATGTLYADESIISGIPLNSESGCPTGWSAEKSLEQQYFTIKNEYNGGNTISMYATKSSAATTVYVSTDGGNTWTSKTTSTSQTILATLASGEKILIKHTGALGGTAFNGHNYISATQNYSVSGNVASLSAGDNFKTNVTLPDYAFSGLFDTTYSKLISCDKLIFNSITTLGQYCCEYMFRSCTNIVTPPELPNVNTIPNYAYYGMFYSCSSLTTAPKLNASTVSNSSYGQMFTSCTSLRVAPELPATTINESCYMSMFAQCTSLTTAPTTLPATRLYANCYNSMFSGCTSLTNIPSILPAGTPVRAAYSQMFKNCSSITKAPVIQLSGTGTNISSLFNMFSSCTLLNEISLPRINTWNSENATNWVSGVSATGTFTKPSGTSIPTGTNGIPSGWTVVNV